MLTTILQTQHSYQCMEMYIFMYAVLYWLPAYDLGTFLMCSVTYHPGWENGEEEGRIQQAEGIREEFSTY